MQRKANKECPAVDKEHDIAPGAITIMTYDFASRRSHEQDV